FQAKRVARISFYVATKLSPQGENLLHQEKWKEAAKEALSEFLKKEEPPRELLDFALSSWPREGAGVEIGAHLADRVKRFPELWGDFFEPELSRADLEVVVERALDRQRVLVTEDQSTDRTWKGFFAAAGQENAAFRYLTEWAKLTPDQRFEPPSQYSEILKSVHEQPLTFLIGPPAVGKTFIALQILWDAHCRGLRVRWIAPEMFESTDGPVPAEYGLPDMKRRIEFLVRRLGPEPLQIPLDSHDFIASNLKPGSIVYIEDPFGKRDDEFEYSLHTYSFFDLDAFVSAIDEGAARAGCHILISSRQGLFDQWVEDRQAKGKGVLRSKLIRIKAKSYDYEQLFRFSRKLAEARGLAEPENIAAEIVSQIRFPYEIERVVLDLPKDATVKDAEAFARKWRGGLRNATQRQLSTEDDGERLFLLVTALEGTRMDYLDLYRGMELSGDGEEALKAALARYRPFVIRQGLTSFIRFFLDKSRKSSEDFREPEDEKFAPTHSSVQEAVAALLASHPEWIERVALALPKSARRHADAAVYLLALGIGGESGLAQDAIATVLFDKKGLTSRDLPRFMRRWPTFGADFKERLFQYLESDPEDIVREVAAWLERIEVPSEDAWRILRLLLRERYLFQGGQPSIYLSRDHAWGYLVKHLQEMPEDLRSALNELAVSKPKLFTYALGEALVEGWPEVPSEFKQAFFHKRPLENEQVQEKVLLAIALRWDSVEQSLRDFFLHQASEAEPRVRAKAASAAWIYWEKNPQVFDPVYMRAVDDPDISVPLEVLSGTGEYDRTRRFAEKLFERADEAAAAEMLEAFLEDSSEPEAEWKARLIQACIERGGALALGVLAAHFFGRNSASPLFTPPESLPKEPEIIRLAALHAYANGFRDRSYLSEEEAIALIEGMNHPYRGIALFYLSIQSVRLPPKIRAYIEGLEEVDSDDGEAVRHGKKERQPEKGPWAVFKFPVQWIAAELKSQEHPS
ncbi:MAG TPA: hypothetical protein VLQ45_06985, partial [Thermoanaerobaculia bacterium]|nr:hypothetical protein [Thermoanaerobaculia bacterium]